MKKRFRYNWGAENVQLDFFSYRTPITICRTLGEFAKLKATSGSYAKLYNSFSTR
jgi:hypothetical protein